MARILVCEDSPTQALHVRMILDSVGHEVTVVHDGQGALDLLREASFDLVLLDVQSHGLNGIDLCRRIRHHPSTASLPVVIMTELREMDDLRRGQEAGANTWIVKPFDPDGFLRRIDRFLPQHERSTTRFGGTDSGEMDAVPTSTMSLSSLPHPAPHSMQHAALHSTQPSSPTTPVPPQAVPTPPALAAAPSQALSVAHPALHLPSSLPVACARSPAPAPSRPTPPSRSAPPAPAPPTPLGRPPSERPARASRSPLSQVLNTILFLSEQAITHPSTPELRDVLLALHQAARHAADLMTTLAEDATAAAIPARRESPVSAPEGREITLVLLVAADSLRRLLESYLERHGMKVHAVGSTAQGLELCQGSKERIDILVTELSQVSHPLLEALGFPMVDSRILYILDNEDPGSHRHLLPEQATVLVKPFTANTLLKKIQEMLPP